MNQVFLRVFQCLEREHIGYCAMRDAQHPDASAAEIDVLVEDSAVARCSELLLQLGFLPLPSFGYSPHRFFAAYERNSDRWFKLDIVSKVAFGSPVPVLHTDLAAQCLQHRQRAAGVFVPSPECELITLLMHCVLDKGRFADTHMQRLKTLCHSPVDEQLMTSLLKSYWDPAVSWSLLTAQIDAEDWEGLQEAGQAITARHMAHQRLSTAVRKIYARGQRKLNRWLTARSPRSVKVALLAPDGAGKSTLVNAVRDAYFFPVRSIYMGLYQRSAAAPGPRALPGVGLALRLASLWQRCLVAHYHQARRRLVLFDRYTYDALLSLHRRPSKMSRWRRWITAHACPAPELVIVLDAPGEVLYARKGEHSPQFLERQRQQYLALKRVVPQMVVVDATQDADQVRRYVISLIWEAQVKRYRRALENRIGQAVVI